MMLSLVLVAAAIVAVAFPAAQLNRLPAGQVVRSSRWQRWATRLRPGARTRPDPLADAASFDLFAACMAAGMSAGASAKVVARSASAQLSESLQRSADRLELGTDAQSAWTAEPGDGDAAVALASMMRRSARAGTSPAIGLAELAATQRDCVRDQVMERAERAGVAISGPLGLCFLPAFVCLGIVPVVIGLAGQVMGNGLL